MRLITIESATVVIEPETYDSFLLARACRLALDRGSTTDAFAFDSCISDTAALEATAFAAGGLPGTVPAPRGVRADRASRPSPLGSPPTRTRHGAGRKENERRISLRST